MTYLHTAAEWNVPKVTRNQVASSIRELANQLRPRQGFSHKVFEDLNLSSNQLFTVVEASRITERAYNILRDERLHYDVYR
jgi:hypothetical protein